MRSFWGLMRAYWFSDRWVEAWTLTFVIALLTGLSAKASVWMAEASGELVNAIAFFHGPDNVNPLGSLMAAAGLLLALVIIKDAGFIGVRHYFSTTLHRKWRAWLDERFNAALLDNNHTHFHLQNGGDPAQGAAAPDNVDQRVQESIKGMTGGAIGLAMGIVGVVMSLYFIGEKLIETSTEVEGLELLGAYGSAVLALTAVAIYVPLNTWLAVKLGGLLERLTIEMQRAEGSYRGELTTFLRRSFHVAASRGETVQKQMHGRLYRDIDGNWGRLNKVHAGYMSFELIYNFVAARFVAYLPGLIPYMNQRIDLKGYVTGAELVNALIVQCSWFIQVMPAIATLKANSKRVIELAEAIERVQRPEDFYARTGPCAFVRGEQEAGLGLSVRRLELMHQGAGTAPFLKADYLRFGPGEWTFLRGESGCGKTSLIKAINGLWPHGSGEIRRPRGVAIFYAAQEVKFPPVTLKELVCLPSAGRDHRDSGVLAALFEAGLAEFVDRLHEEGREGKSWDQILSGGQKQKLVLARILLQRPGLLFLDEATGALDPEARVAFHQSIKDGCPQTTVISVMHEPFPPRAATGAEFYDSVLAIVDGVATKKPHAPALPAELTTILADPFTEECHPIADRTRKARGLSRGTGS